MATVSSLVGSGIEVVREGSTLVVSLANEAGRNVLSVDMMRGLKGALDQAASDDQVRVVLVRHEGSIFSAGADLKAAPDANAAEMFASLLRQIQTSPKPTVVRITGHAYGGGVGLAAAFDISIAASKTTFGFSEVRLGVVPAVIAPICLPKMRRTDALETFLRGSRFDACRAAEIGLITRALDAHEIDEEIAAIIGDLELGGPQALATAKQIIEAVPKMDVDIAITQMAALSAKVFAGDEARAGTAAFKERRSPPWAR